MSKIDASLIRDLRERTGAGMMDCKKALVENNGDMEAAVDWLRKKGISVAEKKSGRVTAEGLVSVQVEGNKGVLLEVNSETDFVSKNDKFQEFVKRISDIVINEKKDENSIKQAIYEGNKTVEEELTNRIATIGENLTIRRISMIETQGSLSYYIHNSVSEGMGKIGVIVSFDSKVSNEELGKQIAMHISAMQPLALSKESLDPEIVEREREVQISKVAEEGKTGDIANKIVEGRIQKYYREVCLLEQSFVMNPDKTVADILRDNNAKIVDYRYFVLGSGIEKEQVDFATEVAMTAGK